MNFLQRQLSENGEPSNTRVMAFMFLSTVMVLILAVVIVPVFRPGTVLRLPDVPPTFETLVEWVMGILILGTTAGKGIKAYQTKGADVLVTKSSETSTEVTKGAKPDESNSVNPTGL